MSDLKVPGQYLKVRPTDMPTVFAVPLTTGQLVDLQAELQNGLKGKALYEQQWFQIDALVRDKNGQRFDNLKTAEQVKDIPTEFASDLINACTAALMGKGLPTRATGDSA